MLKELTILPGINKSGNSEAFEKIIFKAGDTISIVGPTGSGKTALITDIELLAQKDTATKRSILINGEIPTDEIRFNPALKPIAMITQNTKCFADLMVKDFLDIHIRARKIDQKNLAIETIDLANILTGEKIKENYKVTTLSGGQTRSLLIADAIMIGCSPIILLDEIENAGIFKQEVINIINNQHKIIVFVTHDPSIALTTQKRIIAGKTALAKQIVRNLKDELAISFLKIDVVKAYEDIELKNEFNIHTHKIYSGDLCPDHAEVMIVGDSIDWAEKNKSDLLLIESAGLCLRCSPYLTQGLGIAVLSSISGIHAPEKMSTMISLADIVVVTKTDLVSQAEREVMAQKIKEVHPNIKIIETNTLQGTALHQLYKAIQSSGEINKSNLYLKGNPPIGTCTICVGKKEIGWQNHFGVVKKLNGQIADYLYKGE
jgi:Ni2+-binding GTPase involved in maturation of urease and hydrogenase